MADAEDRMFIPVEPPWMKTHLESLRADLDHMDRIRAEAAKDLIAHIEIREFGESAPS
jgi:hypothetical protein